MNKLKKILLTLPLLLLIPLIGLLLPSNIDAAQFHFESYTIPREEIIDEDIYAIGEEVRIDGVVNGDVIILGDVIQLNGTVTGDAYLIGSKIDVNANIYGTTFIFGNNTSVQGLLAENTYIFSTFINSSADVGRNLFAFFVESNIGGSVGGDLRGVGFRSTIDSFVSKDLLILTEQYTTDKEKVIGEIYDSVRIQDIASEQGVELDRAVNLGLPSFRPSWRLNILSAFSGFLSMLLIGFIIIMVAPVKSYAIKERISDSTNEFFASLAVGFVVLILIPFPLFVLLISIIGAPAAFMIAGVLTFILVFGRIWVEMAFGIEILHLFGIEEYRPFKSFLVGRVLSTIVNFIPIVRGLYNTILGLVALGAILRMKRGYYQIANKQAKEYRKKTKSTKKKK